MHHGAYKSMMKRKLNPGSPTVSNKGGLTRWVNEKWCNLTPLLLGDNKFYACGNKSNDQKKLGLPSICRPTVRVSDKTPVLAKEFSYTQLKRALKIKIEGKTIQWKYL